jgi:muramoyltetrapeptide carboxypeptidase
MRKPKVLKKGDTLGVIAPAGVVNPSELDRGMKRLDSLGFKVMPGRHVRKAYRYMAGSDRERAEDLQEMWADPNVSAVVCARGGYGTARLLPLLDKRFIARHPKILVGSSDATALLIYLVQQAGVVSFHGPMVAPNFGRTTSTLTEEGFIKALCSTEPVGPVRVPGIQSLRKGVARGRVVGGCLSILCSLLRTPYEPDTRDAVLLLEDVHEPPYRVDRMLTQLILAGKLDRVRGLIFGRMVDCQPQADEGFSLEEMIGEVLQDFRGPILYGLPVGHGGEQITLPLGVEVVLDGDRGTMTVLESGVEG